jgi:hypothetical protein
MWGACLLVPRLDLLVSRADTRAVESIVRPRAVTWPRRTLVLALLVAVAVAAAATWLEVAKTMHDADPVPAATVPRITGVVWSNRVFVDAATFRRWLAARDVSYTVWARNHPGALARLAQRPRRR